MNISCVNVLSIAHQSSTVLKTFSQTFNLTFDFFWCPASNFWNDFLPPSHPSQVTLAQNLGPAVGHVSSQVRVEAAFTNMECTKMTLTELVTSFLSVCLFQTYCCAWSNQRVLWLEVFDNVDLHDSLNTIVCFGWCCPIAHALPVLQLLAPCAVKLHHKRSVVRRRHIPVLFA